MIAISMNHICLDERGIAYIAGTKMKVRQIVIEKNVWHMTPEEIQQGHDHLSLAQIHAALAYYYDHQSEIEAEIERARREVDELRAQQPKQLTRQELEARWKKHQNDPASPFATLIFDLRTITYGD